MANGRLISELRFLLRKAEEEIERTDGELAKETARRLRKNIARRERDEAMRDMGMKKVRGNLGGTYWE